VLERLKVRRKIAIAIAVAAFLALAGVYFIDQIALAGLSVWAARFDHADLRVDARKADGTPMSSVEFFRAWRPALIARDSSGSPRLGVQHGLGPILVAIPPDETMSLEVLWPVPGFGKLLVRADNCGRGYRVSRGTPLTIELVPELARSRIAAARRWISDHNGGTAASADAARGLDSADALMRQAASVRDPAQRSILAGRALAIALNASEAEVMAEARASIRRNRRGRIIVEALDENRRPLPNLRLRVSQRRFDFLFGAFNDGYDPETIARMRAAGLNYATMYLSWARTEPRDGLFDFGAIDRSFDPEAALAEDGFTVRGHALVWMADAEMPRYMHRMRGNRAAIRSEVERRVAAIVGHYGDRVAIWEANNEGHAAWAQWGLDRAGMIDVVGTAATEIRRLAPQSEIMINLALPLGEDVALKYYPFIRQVSAGRISNFSSDPYGYAEELSRAGVPYDLIGLQFYNGGYVDVLGREQVPAIDLFRFAEELDRYARLGKPIQITEIAAPSATRGGPGESFWHQHAGAATQADYLEGVFTIAYGNQNVRGINWWDFYDNGAFVESGGLFDRSLHPKPAYARLKELLAGWRSDGEVTTGADGRAVFEGAPGDYEVSAVDGAPTASVHAHLAREQTTVVAIDAAGAGDYARQSGARLEP